MIETISRIVIVLFGVALLLLSVWGMVLPARLIGMVKGVLDRPDGMVIAVGARIVLGLSLIATAPMSKFPQAFQILGLIALAAAMVLPFIGRRRLSALIGWFDRIGPSFMRTWLVVGLIFGGFLLYGVI
jgi:hypothetical protein